MILLTKDNLTEYLKEHMTGLDYSSPLSISAIGEGSAEEDGDGYINFVFRVSDGQTKIIVKQAREHGRIASNLDLPMDRGEREYESMKLRSAIVPEYLPKLYFCDKVNHVIVTEDVSHLDIMRFQMMKNRTYPKFARQAGEYLAKTHFYTSEYYLDTETMRKMTIHFMNHQMRNIFDSSAFNYKRTPEESIGGDMDPRFEKYIYDMVMEPRIVMERQKLRHIYISKAEVFVHGDFHTSNVFIDEDELKVIDMEYTFCGPMSYDLGYMESHLLSQYVSAAFRDFDSEEERNSFRSYVLRTMKGLFEEYCKCFFTTCWNADAKDIYQGEELLKESIRHDLLQEMAGFMANANLSRSGGDIGYPEYDMISDVKMMNHSICLSILMDTQILKNRYQYDSFDDVMAEILDTEKQYMKYVR